MCLLTNVLYSSNRIIWIIFSPEMKSPVYFSSVMFSFLVSYLYQVFVSTKNPLSEQTFKIISVYYIYMKWLLLKN